MVEKGILAAAKKELYCAVAASKMAGYGAAVAAKDGAVAATKDG
jgi:hypothetical protein